MKKMTKRTYPILLTSLFLASFFLSLNSPPAARSAFAADNIFTDKIGIGTTGPTATLEILSSNSGGQARFIRSVTGGTQMFLFDSQPATNMVAIEAEKTGGAVVYPTLAFYNSGAAKMVIDNSGYVGIGTTVPTNPLTVEAAGASIKLKSTTGTNSATLSIQNTGGTVYSGIEASSDGYTFTGTTAYSAIFGHAQNYPLQLATNNNVRLTILGTGNVGIGTTGPLGKLQVVTSSDTSGVGAAWDDKYFVVGASSNTGGVAISYDQTANVGKIQVVSPNTAYRNLALVPNAGNVGIGSTGPAYKLDVVGDIRATGTIYGNISAASGSSSLSSLTVTGNTYLATTSGSVGIGTVVPGYLLTLNDASNSLATQLGFGYSGTWTHTIGRANTTGLLEFVALTNNNGFRFSSTAPAAHGDFIVSNMDVGIGTSTARQVFDVVAANSIFSGNVGIGTTSPGAKLNVDGGNFIMTGTATNRLILPLNNAATTPTLAFGDGDSGFYESADDSLRVSMAGTSRWIFNDYNFYSAASGSGAKVSADSASATFPVFTFVDDPDTGIGAAVANTLSFIAGGTNVMNIMNGSVGIGTTAPDSLLHLRKAGTGLQNFITLDNPQSTAAGVINGIRFEGHTDSRDMGGLQMGSLDATGDNYYMSFHVRDASNAVQEYMRILRSGNVGIGTTVPDYLLDVGSDARASNTGINVNADWNYDIGYRISANGATQWYMYEKAQTNDLRFNDGTGDRVTIQDGGNVGIGTTSPQAVLHVKAGTNMHIAIRDAGAVWGAGYTGATIQGTNDAFNATTMLTLGGNPTVFAGGNVGIGTTNPGALFDVYGAMKISGSNSSLTMGTSPTAGPNGGHLTAYGNTRLGSYYVTTTNQIGVSSAAATYSTQFGIWDGSDVFSPAMTIKAGKVGIGTTGPGTILDVSASSDAVPTTGAPSGRATFRSTGGAFLLSLGGYYGGGAENAYIQAHTTAPATSSLLLNPLGGSVGIGTTVPSETFQVRSAPAGGQAQGSFRSNSATNVSYGGIAVSANGGKTGYLTVGDASFSPTDGYAKADWFSIAGTGGVGLRFGANSRSDDMVIATDGNVGIGTTNPAQAKLQVNGEISTGQDGLRWKIYTGTTNSDGSALSIASEGVAFNANVVGASCRIVSGNANPHACVWGYPNVVGDANTATLTVHSDGNIYLYAQQADYRSQAYKCVVFYID